MFKKSLSPTLLCASLLRWSLGALHLSLQPSKSEVVCSIEITGRAKLPCISDHSQFFFLKKNYLPRKSQFFERFLKSLSILPEHTLSYLRSGFIPKKWLQQAPLNTQLRNFFYRFLIFSFFWKATLPNLG